MSETLPKGQSGHSEDAETGSAFALTFRLIGLGFRHKKWLAAALGVTVIMQVMAVSELISAGVAVDVLRKQVNPDAPPVDWPLGLSPPSDTPFMTLLLIAAGAAFMFGVLRAGGYFFSRVTDELLAQSIIVDLRTDLYEKLQELSFSYFDQHDSGTIINRVTGDVQSVRMFIQVVLIRVFTSVTTLIVFVGAMLSIHVQLTLLCMLFVIVQGVVMLNFARFARPAFRIQRKLLDGLTLRLSEAVQGVRVIRAFGRERAQNERFRADSAEARDQRYSIWKLVANHMPIIEGSGWLAVAILIGYGGYLVQLGPLEGGIALGSIWVFFGLLRSLAQQLEPLVRAAGQMPEALTSAERIFAILDTVPAVASPPDAKPLSRGTGCAVEFRNVTFGYNADEPVLCDISLRIEPGETVAFVGPTGSGKTSLIRLVPRFYDPQRGQVLIDGVDAREYELSTLRRAIGFVFQEPYLFSNTIERNIAFGEPDAAEERIVRAARNASAESFIERLDRRYETIVGERGVTLSGGERQRLSLARALLPDPSIVILDDAMSAVDAGTESIIQANLDRLDGSRTTLVVAHRLSTLRRADRVVVIEGGRIHAVGRHDELMVTDGHYREAALIQLEHDISEEQSS